MKSSVEKQPSIYPVSVLIFLFTILLVTVIFALHFWVGVPVNRLTSDPTAALDGAPYIGFLSQLGLWFWSAAAAVGFFVAIVLASSPNSRHLRNFFMTAGILSSMLGIDDGFRIHESVFPHFGVPEEAVVLVYGILTALWLFVFRNVILKCESRLLGIALFFFALSVFLDVLSLHHIPYSSLYEDGAKFIGILYWLTFFVKAGEAELTNRLPSK